MIHYMVADGTPGVPRVSRPLSAVLCSARDAWCFAVGGGWRDGAHLAVQDAVIDLTATATAASAAGRDDAASSLRAVRTAAIAALVALVAGTFAVGAALALGASQAVAVVVAIVLASAGGALLLESRRGRRATAAVPADLPLLSQTAELGRHLETVLAALLDLRSDNARLRDELTRSVGMVQRANRLASVGLLTAGLAHEMRNPLVALRTFAQLLPDRWEDAEFRREFGDVVLSELDRVGRLMNDLLLFTRNQSASFEESTVADVLATVVPLLRAHAVSKRITIEVDVDAPTPRITANVAQLRQVVMNLGLNALHATPAGGRVRIAASGGADSALALVRVSDSGPGIAPEDVPRIFDPFFTTRSDGTGLGLPISREIIERHGGTLSVESTPGAGATFAIELPAVSLAAVANDDAHAAAARHPSTVVH
jgi:signal transduction histidine kinase